MVFFLFRRPGSKGSEQKTGIFHRRMIAALVLCLAILGQGCDPAARHSVLSTLFDGVPPLEGPGTEEAREPVEAAVVDEPPMVGEEETKPTNQTALPPVEIFQHPPYAMKMCDGCHSVPERSRGIPFGFSLLEDKNKICQTCHDDMLPESLGEQYEWVHGPVQYGACLECHHPHESVNPYMLRYSPSRNMCLTCHDEERLTETDMHGDLGDTDCTECHDPHGSSSRYLLRD